MRSATQDPADSFATMGRVPASETSAETAAYVAAGVALLVGLANPFITNLMAARRQRRELQHDRDMRVREDLVQVVDDATQALVRSRRGTESLHTLWKTGQPVEGPNSEAVMTARQQSVEGTRYARSRLATRFGEDSPIVDAYMQALTDVDAYAHSLAGFVETADYAAHVAAITKARLQATQTQTDFFAVARSTLAGSAANSTSDKGKGKPIRYSTPRM